MKKKIFRPIMSVLICLLLITLLGGNYNPTIATAATNNSSGNLKIHYINVGQGDSELIQVNGKNILIDAGTSDEKSLNYLKSLKITKLDYVIATHPHEDHIGSMDDIIKTFNIGIFYAPKVTTTTKSFANMVSALKRKNLKITTPKAGSKLTIGNATLTFLAPNKDKYDDINNYSIVCKLNFGNTSYLFMGDAESLSEGEILAKQLDVKADVLKIGYHGSTSSTSQAFLNKVNPKYAVIEVGKGNDYGHPASATIKKLSAKGIKVFRTDVNGTIIATSDGKNITFNSQPASTNVKPAPSNNKPVTKPVPAPVNKEQMVWIASKTAKVYHSKKTCSNMKNPMQISINEAKKRGLKPCSKCH
ncbi:ComEC/Rec2 family competence protein [Inconstantimicrobium mannanitabidum]|uniref:Uncharacterized protein n=1 Tax=Inconstantimicrobium mannanitabidum TaxID=1604901 RepID=A0ACB5RDY6_9CLOT|nr:ComEC/Rec2 family competence protein [Clostridium sp. TW13]GKX67485.1 hypothetical protein rsdtw13_27430 [Clostridium sp. TW13]